MALLKGLRAFYSVEYFSVDECGGIYLRGTIPRKYVDVVKG